MVGQPFSGLEDHLEREGHSTEYSEILEGPSGCKSQVP